MERISVTGELILLIEGESLLNVGVGKLRKDDIHMVIIA